MHGTTPACPLSPGALFLVALMADKCDWELQIQAPGSSKFGGLGHYGSCWVQVIEKHCVIFIALCQASVSLFHWPCYRHDEELCTEYTDGKWVSWDNANVKFINKPYINLFALDPIRNTLFFHWTGSIDYNIHRRNTFTFPPTSGSRDEDSLVYLPDGLVKGGKRIPLAASFFDHKDISAGGKVWGQHSHLKRGTCRGAQSCARPDKTGRDCFQWDATETRSRGKLIKTTNKYGCSVKGTDLLQ